VRRWVPLDAVYGVHDAPAARHVVEPLLQLLEPVEVQMTGDGQQVQLRGCHRCVCVLRHLLATPTCVTRAVMPPRVRDGRATAAASPWWGSRSNRIPRGKIPRGAHYQPT
jgi:hypothetical protein